MNEKGIVKSDSNIKYPRKYHINVIDYNSIKSAYITVYY